MDLFISSAWAQSQAAPPSAGFGPLIMLGLFFVVFYFLLIRPQQKRAREHSAMVTALAVGEEVVTAGGMLGKISAVGDDYLSLEVAEGVQVKVQKNTIARTLPKGTIKKS